MSALERVRRDLRDLAGFVERTARAIVETSFEDTLMTAIDEQVPLGADWVDTDRGHLTDVAVFKLHHNKPLTDTDLAHLEAMVHLASEGHTEAAIGKERLPTFVRRVVGLDPASLRAELDAYIGAAARTSQQIRFIEGVIAFLSKNGVMDPERLFSQQIADERTIDALTNEQTAPVIAFVRRVNENGGWEGERAVG